jgi:hypothetical protein
MRSILRCAVPFEVTRLQPRRATGISTHALSPYALLQVFRDLHGTEPPPCTLLEIRGTSFVLGEPLRADALAHLDAAVHWALAWLAARTATPAAAPTGA